MDNIEVFQSEDGQWRFRIKANNGEIVAASEGYSVQASAYRGAETLKKILDGDSGMHAISAERARHISKEQYMPEQDVGRSEELMAAAQCYLAAARGGAGFDHLRMIPKGWPWTREHWKPGTTTRNLEKAGALIAAALTAQLTEEGNDADNT